MSNPQSPLRFDHREIAVIFSLFIFVSLLMFTVGILVGKGLTQAKYEGTVIVAPADGRSRVNRGLSENDASQHPESTSVTMNGEAHDAPPEHASVPKAAGKPVEHGEHGEHPEHAEEVKTAEAPVAEAHESVVNSPVPQEEPLKLIPKKDRLPGAYSGSLKEPTNQREIDKLMRNPKLNALMDSGGRGVASVPNRSLPESTSEGKYTVQVGSYPSERDASFRVQELKKLGFPHAYFSKSEIFDKKETWYRVWLGYFSDYESARRGGELLRERGEVRNYLVRKSETTG